MSDLGTLVAELPLEQQAIRAKCFHPSGTFVEFKREEIEQSIPDRFEQQVRKYPGRIAVKTPTHTLTYDELNRFSNHVARALLAQRGEGEEPVALLLEKDAPMVAAILGVLKAGKFYVPLEPSLPRTRATYILEDSQAGLIVTNDKNRSLANELARNALPLMSMDDLDTGLAVDPPSPPISPDSLTWILYTSGSTGQPKGVVQTHRNVLHFIMNYANGLHLCPEDRLTVLSSFSVNAANHDIFTALLNGASLYPLDLKEVGLARLGDWLIQHEITIYHSVPTVFRHFLESLTQEANFPDLRVIRFGGESASKREVELYKKFFTQHCILINRLGSTETGTVCWYFIDKETEVEGNIAPVGYPVDDNEILMLDDYGNNCGIDNVGEIAVRSRYLAPGYWRRPDFTEATFLPDPRGGDQRIYRTGDMGRMLPDGCLTHLGRKDLQVKVRGHRIEVTEIEMALLAHPAIKEAVVVARKDQPGNQRLVAYLLPAGSRTPTVSALRSFLSEKLPDYMIPSVWVFLAALPLAPNGKVDRRALPPPFPGRPELDTPFAAPRTPVEETVARIWLEVLNLDQVGIQDNFLELGGNSLSATQVISRVIERFELELPIQSLFEAPTVQEMAAVIVRNQQN